MRVINALASGPPADDVVRGHLREALALPAQRRIRPYVGATFPFAEAENAHAGPEDRSVLGKSPPLVS